MGITKKRLREIIVEELEMAQTNEAINEFVSVPKNVLSEAIDALEKFELDETLQTKLEQLKEFLGEQK